MNQGSIRLFRVAGIDVYLHWSWFLVAVFEINQRAHGYTSILWNALEYLSLFGLVLMHEFGHALACRQVGGRANRIVLWPLGGVAFVDPPQRPGATLWSIAAGPLVNVALAPVFLAIVLLLRSMGFAAAEPNAYALLRSILFVNVGLLVFNLVPVYPLDGGQILRCLLWFALGRSRSLLVATIIGFVGVGLVILLAIHQQSVLTGVMALFILLCCWQGLRQALAMARIDKMPRRAGFACPSCRAAPTIGAYWVCSQCRTAFDTFESGAVCPRCGTAFAATRCVNCGNQSPIGEWTAPPPLPRNQESF